MDVSVFSQKITPYWIPKAVLETMSFLLGFNEIAFSQKIKFAPKEEKLDLLELILYQTSGQIILLLLFFYYF